MKKSRQDNMMDNFREENERAMLMLDTSPIGAIVFDKKLRAIACNKAAMELYGIESKEEYLKNFIKNCSPEHQPDGRRSEEAALECLKKAFKEGYFVFEWIHKVPADDTLIPTEVTLVRVKYNEEDVVVGYTRDLREYKQMMQELEDEKHALLEMEQAAHYANHSKTIYIANVSHEIRTPMNSILGLSELALNDDIPISTREYLVSIYESAEWLLSIINDVLDMSKIESGRFELEKIPFDLPVIFENCKSAIKPKTDEKEITFFCSAEPYEGKKYIGDPMRLRQVIMNLLSNAVKFTDSGTIKFLASIVDSDKDSVTVYFEIRDTGIGMTAKQVNNIFKPFAQAEKSTSRRFGGTGLGLTISKNIIEMMGGTLNVESAPGKGTKIFFEIRFDLVDEPKKQRGEFLISGTEKLMFKGDVLICEDNDLNQQVIYDNLVKVGLNPESVVNGKECIDLVKKRKKEEKPFDLILMDIQMPVMDGLEAAEIIKKMGVNTPIVALTANIMSIDLERYKAAGMKDTIGKPFTSKDLWTCLAKYLPVQSYSVVDHKKQIAEESKAQKKVRVDFVKHNQTTYEDIVSTVNGSDIKTAYRLAHTLKSNAGLIGYLKLQEAAADVEIILKSGEDGHYNKQLYKEKMQKLKIEMELALDDLAPLLDEKKPEKKEKAGNKKLTKILEELEPLLRSKDTRCLKLLDELNSIDGFEELTEMIEGYKFKQALEALEKVKKKPEFKNE